MAVEENTVGHETENHEGNAISRRQLLKILAAAGGATAVSAFLPNKWNKPMVEVGVLPVHAQTSLVPTIAPTEEPTTYTIIGDSIPGTGDLQVSPGGYGVISDITALLVRLTGTGTVENIPVVMTVEAAPGSTWVPTFVPALPQNRVTDATGLATFGTITVQTPVQLNEEFLLRFTFDTPVGPMTTTLGNFWFGG